MGVVGCKKPNSSIEWIWGEGEEKNPPAVVDPPVDPTDPVTPPVVEKKGKDRLVWIDASANFKDYANDQQRIREDMKRLKSTGFTGVVVDVRPTSSGVLFKSDTENALSKVDAWIGSQYKWIERSATFDYLQEFIDAGSKEGLDVYAAINTFVGGKKCPYGLGETGVVFSDPTKQAWTTVVNTKNGLKSTMELGDGTKFFNPANDAAVDYLLNILEDLASYKGLKGIILDRCRYDDNDLMSDFSPESKAKFENYIGREVTSWPNEIFSPGQNELPASLTTIQKTWLEFRAKTIHDFVEKASDRVHKVNSDIKFGAYVGAWYSTYYNSGVNWGSPKYITSSYYSRWASAKYNSYGYADHCDIMLIGAYASTSSIYGSGEWSMQGFCNRAKYIFADDVPYLGGPDIGNSSGFEKGGRGDLMPQIVDACINSSTGGMFFFDLCHIKMYNYWDDIKKAFDKYLETL